MTRVELNRVSFAYESNSIIDNLSFALDAPAVVGLVGRSGSGKTTLLKLLAGILTPTEGKVDISAGYVSWVPQDAGLFPWLSVSENIMFPLTLARQYQSRERRVALAEQLCEDLGLSEVAGRYPSEASGGERQRTAIARAVAGASNLLLLDEPFASLDPMARNDLRLLMRRVTAQIPLVTIFASHDLFDVATLSDSVLIIQEGKDPKITHYPLPHLMPRRLRSQMLAGSIVRKLMTVLRGRNKRHSAQRERISAHESKSHS